ncbi:MAG TPA: hypothetical protein VF765_33235 [Polyangiaceae bacterium]
MQIHGNAARADGHGSLLQGFCFDCGWPAPQWRRLLGIGARFYASPADARRLIIKCSGACGACDGDALVVTTRPDLHHGGSLLIG